jgi:hypothetical protein
MFPVCGHDHRELEGWGGEGWGQGGEGWGGEGWGGEGWTEANVSKRKQT